MAALILAVFNCPELYNVTLPNYRCTESRANAWRNIGLILGISCKSEDCKRKWKNMRDRYLKEVRMENKSKKQGEVFQSRWKYRQLMNFIAPFAGSRSGNPDITGNNDDDHDNLDMESSLMPDSHSLNSSQSSPTKWLVKDNGASFSNRPRDEDELFLLSFVPALKRLAPQKRCETKMKIQQIMYEAEFNVTHPEPREKQAESDTQE
uniref:BESS domain-containing protein n=1 Tax=Labrus bergylta TaxID=56723 RepID=A0A3Q3G0S8_9LABR